MSLFDKIKETIDTSTSKMSNFNLEQINDKARYKILNERFIPMLKNNGFSLTYEDVESLNLPLSFLIKPTTLTKAFNEDKFEIVEDSKVIRDNMILLQLTPILKKIDNINARFNGKPPAKYFRMDTYMSNETMNELGLTNQDRNYYISILFNSKKTTFDIPINLRPYIYTKRNEHRLIFKRRIPEKLRKQLELFYLKFYTINSNDYPNFKESNNSPIDLENELLLEKEFLEK